MNGPVTVTAGDVRGLPTDTLIDLRKRVVAAVEAGTSQAQVARLFGVSRQTVGAWVRDYRNRGDSAFRPNRRGRRPGEQLALTESQQRWVTRTTIRRTPDDIGLRYLVWSRQAVAELINREFGVMLGITTVGNYLMRWGFPNSQDLLSSLRGRNAAAVGMPSRDAASAPAWISGAEVVWIGQANPQWTIGGEPGWTEVSVLQAVSNRGAMFFLSCSDPFDGKELRTFLDRLVGQLRRRVNLIVSWQPTRNLDEIHDRQTHAPDTAVRFLTVLS